MHMRPWPGKLFHATTKAVTVVWNQTPYVFLSLSKPVRGPPCLEPDNNSLMRPVKAKFLLFVSRTRHSFFLSVSKPVPRPSCLEPDNISLMRRVTAEFLLFVFGTRHNFFYLCQSLCVDLHVWNQTTFH